jgi:hypothetical protein
LLGEVPCAETVKRILNKSRKQKVKQRMREERKEKERKGKKRKGKERKGEKSQDICVSEMKYSTSR